MGISIGNNIKEKGEGKHQNNITSMNSHGDDSEEEEAMLEAMLRAEKIAGECIFHDDWDILQSDNSDCNIDDQISPPQLKHNQENKSGKKLSNKKNKNGKKSSNRKKKNSK